MKTHFGRGDEVQYGDLMGSIVGIHHDMKRVEAVFFVNSKPVHVLFEADGRVEYAGRVMENFPRLEVKKRARR